MKLRFSVCRVSACGTTRGGRPPRFTTPSTAPTAWYTEATRFEREGSVKTTIDVGPPLPAAPPAPPSPASPRRHTLAVPRRHDDDGVDVALAHLRERVVLRCVDDVRARLRRERLAQLSRGWRRVLVGPAELESTLAAALEDEPEHEDEDQREGERPEQGGPVP